MTNISHVAGFAIASTHNSGLTILSLSANFLLISYTFFNSKSCFSVFFPNSAFLFLLASAFFFFLAVSFSLAFLFLSSFLLAVSYYS